MFECAVAVDVLDAEIVDDECKLYAVRCVTEKAGNNVVLYVFVRCKVLYEVLVAYSAGDWVAVHGAIDLEKNFIAVDVLLKRVECNRFQRDVL
jgi:hypothetical protein